MTTLTQRLNLTKPSRPDIIEKYQVKAAKLRAQFYAPCFEGIHDILDISIRSGHKIRDAYSIAYDSLWGMHQEKRAAVKALEAEINAKICHLRDSNLRALFLCMMTDYRSGYDICDNDAIAVAELTLKTLDSILLKEAKLEAETGDNW
jgi:hypothetical protein